MNFLIVRSKDISFVIRNTVFSNIVLELPNTLVLSTKEGCHGCALILVSNGIPFIMKDLSVTYFDGEELTNDDFETKSSTIRTIFQ